MLPAYLFSLAPYSVHAITSKISPVPGSSGIEMLETDTFRIHCFQTLTGTFQHYGALSAGRFGKPRDALFS